MLDNSYTIMTRMIWQLFLLYTECALCSNGNVNGNVSTFLMQILFLITPTKTTKIALYFAQLL